MTTLKMLPAAHASDELEFELVIRRRINKASFIEEIDLIREDLGWEPSGFKPVTSVDSILFGLEQFNSPEVDDKLLADLFGPYVTASPDGITEAANIVEIGLRDVK